MSTEKSAIAEILATAQAEPDKYWRVTGSSPFFTMHSPLGKVLEFTAFQHITSDEEIAKFFAHEIVAKNPAIRKIEELTKEQLDPAYALRQKVIEELQSSGKLQEMAAAQAAKSASPVSTGVGTTTQVLGKSGKDAAAAQLAQAAANITKIDS